MLGTLHQNQAPIVPFHQVPAGMYLMKRPSTYPLIEHYGVLVTGNLVRDLGIDSLRPIMIHQTHPSVRIELAENTGEWTLIGQVLPAQLPLAMSRVFVALEDPNYDLFGNNCEQFARFISTGQKTSTQLWSFGLITTAAALLWMNRDDN